MAREKGSLAGADGKGTEAAWDLYVGKVLKAAVSWSNKEYNMS